MLAAQCEHRVVVTRIRLPWMHQQTVIRELGDAELGREASVSSRRISTPCRSWRTGRTSTPAQAGGQPDETESIDPAPTPATISVTDFTSVVMSTVG